MSAHHRIVAVGVVVAALAVADGATQVDVVRYRDGGVAARLLVLGDGGTRALLSDGGMLSFSTSQVCFADAGFALALLSQSACDDDRDCATVRPEVATSTVGCCYAVEAKVAKSRSLRAALEQVADQCGWATRSCPSDCTAAKCTRGVCRLEESSSR